MRQETNNEIDLLLRRLSRRQGVPLSDADSHNASDHLDADELSSYAENTLPAAARARYTEHLAECSRCRELVVQLSASVPVVAVKHPVTAAVPSALQKFLASFFSPMVLRYAVPALGLIVVAAIGFVVLQKDQRDASVAQLKEPASTTSAPVQNQQESPAASGFHSPGLADSQTQATKRVDPSRDAAAPVTPSATPGFVADGTQTKAIEAPAAKTETAAVANEPPPAAPKPSATVDEMRVDVEGRKPAESVHPTPGTDLARQRVENFKDKEKKTEELQAASARRAAKTGAAQAAPQGAATGGTTSTFRVAEEREKDKEDGVIRSVGGRRFRRQSGAWVDTAYDSDSAIVNVKRDSEQYRALVGDEPGIKNIAEQLEGTIIIVWKGRTYRIR